MKYANDWISISGPAHLMTCRNKIEMPMTTAPRAVLYCSSVCLLLATLPVDADSFVFSDRTYTHSGHGRLHSNWDFVTNVLTKAEAPKNWETPINYKDGSFEFRVEVLEMEEIEQSMVISFGWINSPFDPQRKHTSGGGIYFSKPGLYETTGRIQQISKYRGDNGALTTQWDWSSAYSKHSVFTIINPQANPSAAGFPFKIHITVRIFSADGLVPEKPGELTAAVVSSDRIDLLWTDSSDNEDAFKIDRYRGGGWERIAEVEAGTTHFSDTGLSPGKVYSYRVRAYNAQEGNSFPSGAASGRTMRLPPALASDLTAEPTEAGGLRLHWRDNSDNETHFEIGRSTNGVDFADEITVPANETTYVDSDLVSGVTYHYRIRSVGQQSAETTYTDPIRITWGGHVATAIDGETTGSELSYALLGNFPNPFNAHTTIRFSLPVAGHVTLRIYDTTGAVVRELTAPSSAVGGQHEISWDGRGARGQSLASGVYLYRLRVETLRSANQELTGKLLLLQ